MRLLLILSALSAVACDSTRVTARDSGTDSGNAMDVDMGVAGTNGANRSRASQFTQAWVGLEMVRPRRCDAPGDEEGPRWSPKAPVDLLAGLALGLEQLPLEAHCDVDVKLGRIEDGGSPLGDDLTVLLTGSTIGGTPFEIRMPDEAEFRVDDDASAIAGRGDSIGVLMQFDLSVWIAEIDLDGLPLTDGTALIDKDHNSDLLEDIERAIGRSARIFVDDDGDLEPDP